MKSRILLSSFLVLALSVLTSNACLIQIRVACPSDNTASGIKVCVDGVGCAYTDNLGIASIQVPAFDTYNVCVDASTLPAGATLSPLCQKIKVVDEAPPVLDFVLGGTFCGKTPPTGSCWLTGGGTIGKTKGTP